MASRNLEPAFLGTDGSLRRSLHNLEDDPAGLDRLQDALTAWRSEMEEELGRGLRNLEADHTDLGRLRDMLLDWRSETDIFDVLRLRDQEEFHSNFLAWLLDPQGSHRLGGSFLRGFLLRSGAGARAINANSLRTTKVTRESHVELDGSRGRLDIRILSHAAEFLCVIENKIWSEEGDGQLAHYRQALARDYPSYRIHHVFLTPSGKPSADVEESESWNTMSYKDILELAEETIANIRDAAHQDVAAFLRQYAITLRRNIVPDVSNDVHQLAQRIYRKHQAAIDLIIEHKDRYRPKYVAEGTQMLRDLLEERKQIWWRWGTSNPPYFRFSSANWAKYECLRVTEWPRAPLLFEIAVADNSMTMSLLLVPVGEEALRRKIFECVKENSAEFNCQENEFNDGWFTLHRAEDILTSADYENWWNEEAIRETISRRLGEFAETKLPGIDKVIVECLEEYEAGTR